MSIISSITALLNPVWSPFNNVALNVIYSPFNPEVVTSFISSSTIGFNVVNNFEWKPTVAVNAILPLAPP